MTKEEEIEHLKNKLAEQKCLLILAVNKLGILSDEAKSTEIFIRTELQS